MRAARRLVFFLPSPNLPASHPPAKGLHGRTPMPNCCAAGRTSRSIPRTRIEYGGCLVGEGLFPPPLGRPLRRDDLIGREGRRSKVADLSLVDEITQRAKGLFDVGRLVRSVDLI